MDSDSDDSVGWINASSDSESSASVSSEMEINHEQDNVENLVNNSDRKKHKKAKKRKHDDDSSVSEDKPAKRKYIKIEPESDKDKSEPGDNAAHSESFDNLRIKRESADDTEVPKKKKKKKDKKSEVESNNESTFTNAIQDSDTLEISSVKDSVRKKKKKKKSKHSESEDVGHEISTNFQEDIVNNGNEQSIVKESKKRDKVPSSTFIENDLNVTNETINISAIPTTVPKKTKRISDRLKFEDDEIENGYESDKDVSFSKEVKTFMKKNPNFSTLTSFSPFKTDEEDILILKCPSEIDINNFKDVNLVLDGKSKIKVAGQTYDGIIAEMDTKLPLVTYSKKSVHLKNMSVLKTIVFHKRIPVPHIQDDSVVTNNQSRFIPLPDTKCRHPLFGTDYKKAIKVPRVVRERLSENDIQPEVVEQENLYKNKKKKNKKEKETIDRDSEVDSCINIKEEGESSKKKKKKRKIKEETEAKPAKRIKLEQNPEAWESEKAIEENLFNF